MYNLDKAWSYFNHCANVFRFLLCFSSYKTLTFGKNNKDSVTKNNQPVNGEHQQTN